ncbi:MAG: tetratricopeptide repeat protein [Acidobacteria bacterium]|nr:tetratricopeptide repeat protein [Acidobacteriota bacterium]
MRAQLIQRCAAVAAVWMMACSAPLPQVPAGSLHARVREQLTAARAEGTSRYCRMLHAYELYREAVACYEQRPATPYLLGAALSAMGRHEEAIVELRKAPPGEAARIRLGEALLTVGRAKEALAEFERGGASVAARFGMARAGSPQAVDLLRSVLRDDPQAGPPRLMLARLLRESGKPEEAEREPALWRSSAQTAVAFVDPEYDKLRKLRRDPGFFFEEGRRRQEDGDLVGAEYEYRRALEMGPNFGAAHANLLSAAGARGDWAAAERHYRQATPATEEVHANWGRVLVAQGRFAEAAEAFRAAIARADRFADAHHDLGFALQQLGRAQEAMTAYRRAIEIDPQHRMAHLHLGILLLAGGRKTEAAAEFERVMMPPGRQAAQLVYAAADGLQTAGRRDRGREFAQVALEYARGAGEAEFAAQIERGLAILSRP